MYCPGTMSVNSRHTIGNDDRDATDTVSRTGTD